MKRIVRLTESDLTRIVRRVISEQTQTSDAIKKQMDDINKSSGAGIVKDKTPIGEIMLPELKKKSGEIVNMLVPQYFVSQGGGKFSTKGTDTDGRWWAFTHDCKTNTTYQSFIDQSTQSISPSNNKPVKPSLVDADYKSFAAQKCPKYLAQ